MTKSFDKRVDSIIKEMRNGIEDSDSDFHYQICEEAKTALLALVWEEVGNRFKDIIEPSNGDIFASPETVQEYIKSLQSIAEHFRGGR